MPDSPGLPDSDNLFRLAIEASPTGVLVMGTAGLISLANTALERQFGYARGELIGQSAEVVLPGCLRAVHAAGREWFGRRKDGSQMPVEIGLTSIETAGDPLTLVSVVDVSDRRRLEGEHHQTIQRRFAFERLVSEISARFVNLTADQVDPAIEDAQRRISEALTLDRCGLVEVSDADDDFVLTHHWPLSEAPPLPRGSLTEQFPWTMAKIRNGEVVCFSSVDEVPSDVERDSLRRRGTKSRVAIPLSLAGKVVGAITLARTRKEEPWPEDVITSLQLVAQAFTSVLARKRADVALQATKLELETSLAEVQRLRDQLVRENVYLRRDVQERLGSGPVVGQSPAVRRALAQVEQVAATDSTVLLMGETGTGKELFAAQIHERSARRAHTMVRVNCAAIPTTLIESELFGREKGAFTGALARQIGRFELADQSTIFLDEIGDLPRDTQVKLLRVLEERQIERLGSPKSLRINVRIIAATHRDLESRIADGSFREDLFYRLNVFPIHIPPLRERPGDIPDLVWRFVGELSKTFAKPIEAIDKESMAALQQYEWPGNIRELRNVVERAMIVATGPRLIIALPAQNAPGKTSLKLDDVEREHIRMVLDNSAWRIRGAGGAAARLGLKPTTLEYRLEKLGIKRPR